MNPKGVQHTTTLITAITNVESLRDCDSGFPHAPGVRGATPGCDLRQLRILAYATTVTNEQFLYGIPVFSFRVPSDYPNRSQ